jgi:hypothetical protein
MAMGYDHGQKPGSSQLVIGVKQVMGVAAVTGIH